MDKYIELKMPEVFFPDKLYKCERIGSLYDGGYEIPVVNLDDYTLISGGLSFNLDFESDLYHRGVTKQLCFDHTVNLTKLFKIMIKNLHGIMYERHDIRRKRFNGFAQYIKHFLHAGNTHIALPLGDGLNAQFISDRLSNEKNLVKLDIEGAEYHLFEDILSVANNIDILAIEFHQYSYNKDLIIDFVKKIKISHDIANLNANNSGKSSWSDALEFVFIRKGISDFQSLELDHIKCTPNNPKKNAICLLKK